MSFVSRFGALLVLCACAGSASAPRHPRGLETPADRARVFLEFYNASVLGMTPEVQEASWASSTDVNDRNTGRRTGADAAYGGFTGNRYVIRTARSLLEHRSRLDRLTVRQLEKVLYAAASAPMT